MVSQTCLQKPQYSAIFHSKTIWISSFVYKAIWQRLDMTYIRGTVRFVPRPQGGFPREIRERDTDQLLACLFPNYIFNYRVYYFYGTSESVWMGKVLSTDLNYPLWKVDIMMAYENGKKKRHHINWLSSWKSFAGDCTLGLDHYLKQSLLYIYLVWHHYFIN